MNSLQRFQHALRGEPVDHVPVFPLLMFFASNRAGISFRQFATDGHALAEAQLLMRERYPLDALTVCSDAFRVPADLGGEMAYPEDKTPFLVQPIIRTRSDLARLGRPDPTAPGSRMADRVKAIAELYRAVGQECPVLGWVDMPFAESCSLVGVSEFMLLLHDDPVLAHEILDTVTQIEIDFALAQLEAGAIMIGAGDAATSLISPPAYREFALPYEQRVIEAIHAAGGLVKLHICGNTTRSLEDMVHSGADLYNVDHMVPFERACQVYGAADACFKEIWIRWGYDGGHAGTVPAGRAGENPSCRGTTLYAQRRM